MSSTTDDGRVACTDGGAGPAVIVIHEMPGLHPLVIRFADRVAAAGMTVFLPVLFGDAGREATKGYALGEILKGICIRREFAVWATDRSSLDRGLAARAGAQSCTPSAGEGA